MRILEVRPSSALSMITAPKAASTKLPEGAPAYVGVIVALKAKALAGEVRVRVTPGFEVQRPGTSMDVIPVKMPAAAVIA